MKDTVDIVLCRPEGPRACSACCGCFNLLDISRESVAAFLKRGSGRVRSSDRGISPERQPDTRDTTTHVCPYQGLDASALPGCLLHPSVRGADGRGASLYGERICEEFFCPAHYLLDEGRSGCFSQWPRTGTVTAWRSSIRSDLSGCWTRCLREMGCHGRSGRRGDRGRRQRGADAHAVF